MNSQTTSAPKTVRRRITLPAKKWIGCALTLEHMRYCGGALVSAESAQTVYELPAGRYTELYNDGESVIAYSRINYLKWLQRGLEMNLSGVNDVCGFTESDEGRITYLYTAAKLHFERQGALFDFSSVPGGQSVVTHRGRVFAASGARIYWSMLLQTSFKDKSAQGAGSVLLPDHGELGDVLRMVSVGDRIYLFRRYGVTRLYAGADTMEFRLEGALMRYASLQARSVATDCGKIYFFADETLYRLEGESAVPVPDAATDKIDFTAKIFGACSGGSYYAAVRRRDGKNSIYSYDAPCGCGRFLGIEALSLTALKGLYFLRGDGRVCMLGGSSGAETGETSAAFEYDLTTTYDETTYLEAVTIDGQGMYAVEASANGEKVCAKGAAGMRLRFGKAFRAGKVTLKIKPLDPAFVLKGVTLFKRRESDYGN